MKARFEGVRWYCDNCEAFLNKQSGFTDWNDSWTCTKCGHENRINKNEIYASKAEYRRSKKQKVAFEPIDDLLENRHDYSDDSCDVLFVEEDYSDGDEDGDEDDVEDSDDDFIEYDYEDDDNDKEKVSTRTYPVLSKSTRLLGTLIVLGMDSIGILLLFLSIEGLKGIGTDWSIFLFFAGLVFFWGGRLFKKVFKYGPSHDDIRGIIINIIMKLAGLFLIIINFHKDFPIKKTWLVIVGIALYFWGRSIYKAVST